MKIAFTGHRKVHGQYLDLNSPTKIWMDIEEAIRETLVDLMGDNPSEHVIISGMALGVDTLAADIAIDIGCPLHAYVPCPTQSAPWPRRSQETYKLLMSQATGVNVVSARYDDGCMQRRNEAMVQAADVLIAVWDGQGGGTANCIRYAMKLWYPECSSSLAVMSEKLGKPGSVPNERIRRINPDDLVTVPS